MLSDKKIKFIVRIAGIVIFLTILICLILIDINLSGRQSIYVSAEDNNSKVSQIFPVSRTIVNDNWNIIDEPVYFTTRMSAPYDNVELKIKYKNDCCQQVLIGLQTGDNWSYEGELLDNKDFNNLAWPKTILDNLSVWSNVEGIIGESEIISGLANSDKIASYNIPSDKDYIIEDYSDYKVQQSININLSGDYSMLVYVNDRIYLDFNFIGDNISTIKLYDNSSNLIKQDETLDSNYILEMNNLKTGIYKISISTDNITNSIASINKYINFTNQLSLNGGKHSLLSNASTIRIKSLDYSGLQNIIYADNDLAIDTINNKYYLRDLSDRTYLDIPSGNIQIYSDGLFSFNDDYLLDFIPGSIKRITDESDYEYLIAKYHKPIIDGDYSINTVSFDLASATISDNKLRFIIGALGSSIDNPFIIESIEILYEKKSGLSFWTEFIDYLKYCWRNIR